MWIDIDRLSSKKGITGQASQCQKSKSNHPHGLPTKLLLRLIFLNIYIGYAFTRVKCL